MMIESMLFVRIYENGCPWNEYACYRAIENGHLEMLKYLYENGCHVKLTNDTLNSLHFVAGWTGWGSEAVAKRRLPAHMNVHNQSLKFICSTFKKQLLLR